jgi:hypothetical protein
MTATVTKLPSVQRMICESCGAEANAACNCGVPYLPKAVRAAEAIEANPEKSDRAIAKELGVSDRTVNRARPSTATHDAVGQRTGLDGKTRSLRKRISDDEMHHEAANRRRVFMQCVSDSVRKAEQGAGLVDALGEEIDDEILNEFDRLIEVWSKLRAEMVKRREAPCPAI